MAGEAGVGGAVAADVAALLDAVLGVEVAGGGH